MVASLPSTPPSDDVHVQRFLGTLGPRLAAARRIESELDRLLARRFNPLDYLRTDELGLSRIIADLLDPNAAHGQGDAFLALFLARVSGVDLPPLDAARFDTRCERSIDGDRRLDISIEIAADGREPACIAIENKPYADDGEGQVQAYLEFLRCRYPGRFILIYLSPHGGLPSPTSLPPDEPTDGLATMAYTPCSADTALQLDFALTDWLRECSLSCDIDRLRWFLRDTERFCHKTFGGTLTTDTEHQDVRDFILESDENLRAASAVFDAYPNARDAVVAGFLETLRSRIADELADTGLKIGCSFEDKPAKDGVWVCRDSWQGEPSTPYVWLGHESKNASWWYSCVFLHPSRSKHARAEKLTERLTEVLGESPLSWGGYNYPWARYLDEHRDWAPLLIQLNQERSEPGKLVDHFATKFSDFARKAIKVIDESLD